MENSICLFKNEQKNPPENQRNSIPKLFPTFAAGGKDPGPALDVTT